MWILHLLPEALILWVSNLLLAAGLALTVAAFFIKSVPVLNQYRLPAQILGIALLVVGVYWRGGYAVEQDWRERVAEVEAKLAVAQKRSAEVNTEIVTKLVTQTKIVKERGDDIIRYVDREVVKNQEVIKFVENCPIPEIIINTHNAAALNRPIEEKK
jgi:hypothetical protein